MIKIKLKSTGQLILTWLLTSVIGISISGQDEAKARFQGPQYEIIANSVHEKANMRSVYVLLESGSYSQTMVSQVIQELDKKFCGPFSLGVTIFSDRKMLDWLIKGTALDVIDFDYSTAEGRKGAAEYLSRIYPPPTGYLRAHYYRNERWEYFNFSPAADSMEMKLIVIGNPDGSLKADGYADFPKSDCKAK